MKILTFILMIFEIVLLAGGCTFTTEKLIPATSPNVLVDFFGFSVQPPNGQNWFVHEQSYLGITYAKTTENKEKHTVIAMAVVSRFLDQPLKSIKELLKYIKQTKKTVGDDSRYKAEKQSISELQVDHAACVRVDFTAEDHGVPYDFGASFILQGFDIICIHPYSPHLLIRLGFSQRFEEGKTPLMLQSESNSFMESISFKEIR